MQEVKAHKRSGYKVKDASPYRSHTAHAPVNGFVKVGKLMRGDGFLQEVVLPEVVLLERVLPREVLKKVVLELSELELP